MTSKPKNHRRKQNILIQAWLVIWNWYLRYWQRNLFHKIVVCIAVLLALTVAGAYGIARWYMWTQSSKPLVIGTSFIPDYARSLGVNPEETLDAILNDLGFKQLRFVGYWDKIEAKQGTYDFSELDWQFEKANKAGAKVSLAIGLRQPRWPECHMPTWAASQPKEVWAIQLKAFMKKVIERYKDNPALVSYQLENEYFLTVFGECPDFSRDRLVDEFNLVKDLDNTRPVIITRSNNAWGFPVGQPQADLYGVSVYKRVWDITVTKRYVEYPFPAWFYGFLGGGGKILTGKDLFIHELQTEPWTPNGKNIPETSLEEQNKSLSAERLRDRIDYGKGTGMREIDTWGSEYWYYRKEILRDPSVWQVAKEALQKADRENAEIKSRNSN